MRKIKEFFKNIIIFLLVAVILALMLLALPAKTIMQSPFLSEVLAPFATYLGISRAELTHSQQSSSTSAEAAQPIAITVKNAAGRSSFRYDAAAIDGAYETLGGLLAQALDTAQPPLATTRARMFDALGSVSVTFRYPGALPSGALAAWLGVQSEIDSVDAEFFVLAISEGAVRLYLSGEDTLVCQTQLRAEDLQSLCDTYRPDGSFFVFEDTTGRFDRLDKGSLLITQPTLRSVAAANPCDSRYATDLAAQLGFNPYGDASYTDTAGNAFFSDSVGSVRISENGEILVQNEDADRFASAADTDAARIEAARTLLGKCLANVQTDAELSLLQCVREGEQTVCTFDYILNGTQVRRTDGPAASVRFIGTTLRSATVAVRAYTLQLDTLALLPAAQAAAIVPDGQELLICYADNGGESLSAGWCV